MTTKLNEAAYWELQALICTKLDGPEDRRKAIALDIISSLIDYNILSVKYDQSTPEVKYSNLDKLKTAYFNGYNYF